MVSLGPHGSLLMGRYQRFAAHVRAPIKRDIYKGRANATAQTLAGEETPGSNPPVLVASSLLSLRCFLSGDRAQRPSSVSTVVRYERDEDSALSSLLPDVPRT